MRLLWHVGHVIQSVHWAYPAIRFSRFGTVATHDKAQCGGGLGNPPTTIAVRERTMSLAADPSTASDRADGIVPSSASLTGSGCGSSEWRSQSGASPRHRLCVQRGIGPPFSRLLGGP